MVPEGRRHILGVIEFLKKVGKVFILHTFQVRSLQFPLHRTPHFNISNPHPLTPPSLFSRFTCQGHQTP